ncbi:MlaD family protein [Aeoliella sp. SH292]|uniref:MlaD family protein n=1 Tax=Aeoliella sp. SH292 TaxID=3454464 RepID=UPI003F983D10
MDERRMQRLVGMVVLFTITFLGVLLIANNPTSSPWGSRGYEIFLDVPSAPGIAVNTPVRKDGVLVGRVAGLEWTDDGVRLRIRIDREDVRIYENDEAKIEPSSLLGDAVVTFTRKPVTRSTSYPPQTQTPADSRVPILAGAVVDGTVMEDPLAAITELNQKIGPSIEKLGEAGEKISVLAEKVNVILGDDIGNNRLHRLIDETTLTMQDFRRTTNNIDQMLGDEQLRQQMRTSMEEFPKLITDARATLQRAGQTLANFDTVIASADRNMRNIEGITKPLGERGEELADLLISSIDNLDIVMKDMSRFAGSLNTGEGLLGRLVRDKKMSDDVDLLVKNANVLIFNINERVRSVMVDQIVENLKIFTDKIAREPGRIIGGALNPSITK